MYVVEGVEPRGLHAVVGEDRGCCCWRFWRGRRRFAAVVTGTEDGEGGAKMMAISVDQLCHPGRRVERHY